ncbi:hypothetical protein [Sediminibacterium soli]|nr:hypothetical protein [Sediminibacterium soli]
MTMRIIPHTKEEAGRFPPQRKLALAVAFLSVFGFFIKILFF